MLHKVKHRHNQLISPAPLYQMDTVNMKPLTREHTSFIDMTIEMIHLVLQSYMQSTECFARGFFSTLILHCSLAMLLNPKELANPHESIACVCFKCFWLRFLCLIFL